MPQDKKYIYNAAKAAYVPRQHEKSEHFKALKSNGYTPMLFTSIDLPEHDGDHHAVIFHNPETNHFLIASAGTRGNIHDLMADAEFSLGDIPEDKFAAAQEMNKQLLEYSKAFAKNGKPKPQFEYIGHSLGAIMSQLSAFDMVIKQREEAFEARLSVLMETNPDDVKKYGEEELQIRNLEFLDGEITNKISNTGRENREEEIKKKFALFKEKFALERKIANTLSSKKVKKYLAQKVEKNVIEPVLQEKINDHIVKKIVTLEENVANQYLSGFDLLEQQVTRCLKELEKDGLPIKDHLENTRSLEQALSSQKKLQQEYNLYPSSKEIKEYTKEVREKYKKEIKNKKLEIKNEYKQKLTRQFNIKCLEAFKKEEIIELRKSLIASLEPKDRQKLEKTEKEIWSKAKENVSSECIDNPGPKALLAKLCSRNGVKLEDVCNESKHISYLAKNNLINTYGEQIGRVYGRFDKTPAKGRAAKFLEGKIKKYCGRTGAELFSIIHKALTTSFNPISYLKKAIKSTAFSMARMSNAELTAEEKSQINVPGALVIITSGILMGLAGASAGIAAGAAGGPAGLIVGGLVGFGIGTNIGTRMGVLIAPAISSFFNNIHIIRHTAKSHRLNNFEALFDNNPANEKAGSIEYLTPVEQKDFLEKNNLSRDQNFNLIPYNQELFDNLTANKAKAISPNKMAEYAGSDYHFMIKAAEGEKKEQIYKISYKNLKKELGSKKEHLLANEEKKQEQTTHAETDTPAVKKEVIKTMPKIDKSKKNPFTSFVKEITEKARTSGRSVN